MFPVYNLICICVCRSGLGKAAHQDSRQVIEADDGGNGLSLQDEEEDEQHAIPWPGRLASDAAAPDTASTAVWGDWDIPISPAVSPVGGTASGQQAHAYSQRNDLQAQSQSTDQPHALYSHDQVDVMPRDDAALASSSDASPTYRVRSLQRRLSLSSSTIDLLTPSTGAASISTVATPTFSESCEVLDLTQT